MHAMTTHDRQATPLRWQMQFSPVRKCVPLARALVSKTLASWGYGQEDIDRVVLVCGELSANAVEHGGRRGHLFEVRLTIGPHCLVEVSDASRTPPAPPRLGRTTKAAGACFSSLRSLKRPATTTATRSARPSGPA